MRCFHHPTDQLKIGSKFAFALTMRTNELVSCCYYTPSNDQNEETKAASVARSQPGSCRPQVVQRFQEEKGRRMPSRVVIPMDYYAHPVCEVNFFLFAGWHWDLPTDFLLTFVEKLRHSKFNYRPDSIS